MVETKMGRKGYSHLCRCPYVKLITDGCKLRRPSLSAHKWVTLTPSLGDTENGALPQSGFTLTPKFSGTYEPEILDRKNGTTFCSLNSRTGQGKSDHNVGGSLPRKPEQHVLAEYENQHGKKQAHLQ